MTSVEVVPAALDDWPDVISLLGGNGDKGCWCLAPSGRAVGYGRAAPGACREIAGWCGSGSSDRWPRILMRLEFATEPSPALS
jgi:hypothetical protein